MPEEQDARRPHGVRISFQGLPCLRGHFHNIQGTRSGSGSVIVTTEDTRNLKLNGDPWARLDAGSAHTVVPETRDGLPASLGAGIRIRGELEFKHGPHVVTLPHLYVSDEGLADVYRSDELRDRGLARIPLVDIRYLWSRGDVHGDYNVTRKGILRRGFEGTVDRTDAAGFGLLPESVKPGGDPYTLRDLIDLCLTRLPGQLSLVGPKDELAAAKKIIPLNVVWKAESALNALDNLLATWNFVFVYDAFGHTAQVWRASEGAIRPNGESGVRVGSLTFAGAAGTTSIPGDTIRERHRTTRYFYRPRVVRVVGKPVIREVRIDDLEPVGEVDGEIVPLDEALASLRTERPQPGAPDPPGTDEEATPGRMSRADAARWVLLPTKAQRAWRKYSLSDHEIKQLHKWAFKWFRLPEWAQGFLPMLPYRARAAVVGGNERPLVFADSFGEIPFEQWVAKFEAQRVQVTAQLRQATAEGLAAAGKLREEFGEFSEVPRFKAAALNSVLNEITEDLRIAAAKARIEEREIAASERNELRLYNLYLAPRTDVDIDGRNGVLRFGDVVGTIHLSRARATTSISKIQGASGLSQGPTGNPANVTGQGLQVATEVFGEPIYVASQTSLKLRPRASIVFAYESSMRARASLDALAASDERMKAFLLGLEPSFDKVNDYEDSYSFLGDAPTGRRDVLPDPADGPGRERRMGGDERRSCRGGASGDRGGRAVAGGYFAGRGRFGGSASPDSFSASLRAISRRIRRNSALTSAGASVARIRTERESGGRFLGP